MQFDGELNEASGNACPHSASQAACPGEAPLSSAGVDSAPNLPGLAAQLQPSPSAAYALTTVEVGHGSRGTPSHRETAGAAIHPYSSSEDCRLSMGAGEGAPAGALKEAAPSCVTDGFRSAETTVCCEASCAAQGLPAAATRVSDDSAAHAASGADVIDERPAVTTTAGGLEISAPPRASGSHSALAGGGIALPVTALTRSAADAASSSRGTEVGAAPLASTAAGTSLADLMRRAAEAVARSRAARPGFTASSSGGACTPLMAASHGAAAALVPALSGHKRRVPDLVAEPTSGPTSAAFCGVAVAAGTLPCDPTALCSAPAAKRRAASDVVEPTNPFRQSSAGGVAPPAASAGSILTAELQPHATTASATDADANTRSSASALAFAYPASSIGQGGHPNRSSAGTTRLLAGPSVTAGHSAPQPRGAPAGLSVGLAGAAVPAWPEQRASALRPASAPTQRIVVTVRRPGMR
jgi:hypothetical protein